MLKFQQSARVHARAERDLSHTAQASLEPSAEESTAFPHQSLSAVYPHATKKEYPEMKVRRKAEDALRTAILSLSKT